MRPDGALNYSLTNTAVRELLCALLAVSYPLLLPTSLLFFSFSPLSTHLPLYSHLLFPACDLRLYFLSLHLLSLRLLSIHLLCLSPDLHISPLGLLGPSHLLCFFLWPPCITILSLPPQFPFAYLIFCCIGILFSSHRLFLSFFPPKATTCPAAASFLSFPNSPITVSLSHPQFFPLTPSFFFFSDLLPSSLSALITMCVRVCVCVCQVSSCQ